MRSARFMHCCVHIVMSICGAYHSTSSVSSSGVGEQPLPTFRTFLVRINPPFLLLTNTLLLIRNTKSLGLMVGVGKRRREGKVTECPCPPPFLSLKSPSCPVPPFSLPFPTTSLSTSHRRNTNRSNPAWDALGSISKPRAQVMARPCCPLQCPV